jgi:hypothetical protein
MAKKKDLSDMFAGSKLLAATDLSRSLSDIGGIASHLRMAEDFGKMVDPLGTRTTLELAHGRGLLESTALGGLSKLAALDDTSLASTLHGGFAARLGLGDALLRDQHFESLSKLYSFHNLIESDGLRSMRTMHAQFASLGEPPEWLRGYEMMDRLSARIESSLGVQQAVPWDAHLAGIAAPSMSLLATGRFDRLTGVLSSLGALGASLTWLHAADDSEYAAVAAAALFREDGGQAPAEHPPKRILVRAQVICHLCNEPMIMRNDSYRWESEADLVIDVSIIPLCAKCTDLGEKDPSYWSKKLRDVGRPRFELIEGGRQGDERTPRRGELFLVETSEDPENEDE